MCYWLRACHIIRPPTIRCWRSNFVCIMLAVLDFFFLCWRSGPCSDLSAGEILLRAVWGLQIPSWLWNSDSWFGRMNEGCKIKQINHQKLFENSTRRRDHRLDSPASCDLCWFTRWIKWFQPLSLAKRIMGNARPVSKQLAFLPVYHKISCSSAAAGERWEWMLTLTHVWPSLLMQRAVQSILTQSCRPFCIIWTCLLHENQFFVALYF